MPDTETPERANSRMQAQQDTDHGQCLVALVVGALAGAATGVGVGMVIGAWVL